MSEWIVTVTETRCPECGCRDVEQRSWAVSGGGSDCLWKCNGCGHTSEEHLDKANA